MHELLERTIKEASKYFQNFLVHEYARKTALHKVDARLKLLSTLILVILAVSTFSFEKVLLLNLFLLAISFAAGISLGRILERIWLFTLFSFLVILPVSFSNPQYLLTFTLRVAASMVAIQLLIMTTSFSEICSAFRFFRIPETFVSAMWLAYRYTTIMLMELLTILLARESRRVSKGSHMDALKKGSEALGLFFLRSFERAERIQLAMEARGERINHRYGKLKMVDAVYAAIVLTTIFWWVVI